MGCVTTNATGICLYCPEHEAATLEDAGVGCVHLIIGVLERVLAGMEGVGVLHQEFPGPHYTKAWPYLVPEFGLDLVVVYR